MYVDPATTKNLNNYSWVARYAKPDRPRFILVCALWLIEKALFLTIPILSGMIVNKVIVAGQTHLLWPLGGGMILAAVVRATVRYTYQINSESFGQNTLYRLVSDEYEKLHSLDFTYFNHTRTGDIMNRMTQDTDYIRHTVSWDTYQVADCFALFIGSMSIMFVLDWRLASVLLVVSPVIWYVARQLSKTAHPIFVAMRGSLSEMNSEVEENIEGNRVVKAFVREDFEISKFDKRNEDYFDKNISIGKINRKYQPWFDGSNWFMLCIVLIFGGWLVIKGHMSLGLLVTFTGYLGMIQQSIGMSGWLINDIQRFNASCIKIRGLLTADSRITEETADESKRESHIAGEITFDHVSFAFPDDPEQPVLADIDLHIPSGSKLGILGETGSGKSTLVSLISRFYDPTSGTVRVDGVNTKDWPLATLRSQVLIVAQDTFLFSDTVGGNIAFGADSDDRETITDMAHIAGADGFITHLPQGYETVVGERGVGLSGGQKQRLSLARALADDPSILIMDDTTSAVDMETEAKIQEHLQDMGGNRTIITIAHRISSVKDSDLIVVLEHGRIVEQGSHAQLVEKHGRYYEIYRKQLGLASGSAQGFEG